MSVYTQRIVPISNETLAASQMMAKPVSLFPQGIGRITMGYQFSGSGTLTLKIQHLSPDGSTWIDTDDGTLISNATSGAKVDSYSFTWGVSLRLVAQNTSSTQPITGLYVWFDIE